MVTRVRLKKRPDRDEAGRIKKGFRGPGRTPGKPNKVTAQLRTAILEAAAMVGYDGEGKYELHGYLARLAENEPQVFGRLLERVLPMQIVGTVSHTTKYETVEDVQRALRERGLPPRLIDITPTRVAAE